MNEAERRREQILEAADRLLRHYGPQKTTVADVAREAGIGVGSVYLEFPSKDALIEELSRSRLHAVLGAMRAVAADGSRPYAERLPGALDARLAAYRALADEGAHACDLVRCRGSAVSHAHASFQQEELSLLMELLRRGAEAGELEVADPEACARSLLRAYASFAPPWISGRDGVELQQAQAAMHALVLRGLLRRTPLKVRRG
jgi:AcrR family transcriptional regulator